jgi:hypothetical protein
VNAIDRQKNHDREIRQQQRRVKEIPVVESLEGLIGVLHRLQVVAQAVLGIIGQVYGYPHWQLAEQAGGGIE